MKEHVQECPVNGMPIHMSDLDQYYGRYECQCEILRACEERVMSQFIDGIELVSYRRGLDAARAAVAGLPTFEKPYPWCGDVQHCGGDEVVELNAALAAIDALQEGEK